MVFTGGRESHLLNTWLSSNQSSHTSLFGSNSIKILSYSTMSKDDKPQEEPQSTPESQLSSKDKLKRAVKEYGLTVVVFHVTISLASLGVFYLIVSRLVIIKHCNFRSVLPCSF